MFTLDLLCHYRGKELVDVLDVSLCVHGMRLNVFLLVLLVPGEG